MEAVHSVHRILSQLMPDKRGNRKVTTTKTSAKTKSIAFPMVRERRSRASSSLTWARTERRARGERAGAHAEARAERRGNVAEEVAAAGAAAFASERGGGVGAEPVTAGFA